jgi:hypothetical protein
VINRWVNKVTRCVKLMESRHDSASLRNHLDSGRLDRSCARTPSLSPSSRRPRLSMRPPTVRPGNLAKAGAFAAGSTASRPAPTLRTSPSR